MAGLCICHTAAGGWRTQTALCVLSPSVLALWGLSTDKAQAVISKGGEMPGGTVKTKEKGQREKGVKVQKWRREVTKAEHEASKQRPCLVHTALLSFLLACKLLVPSCADNPGYSGH